MKIHDPAVVEAAGAVGRTSASLVHARSADGRDTVEARALWRRGCPVREKERSTACWASCWPGSGSLRSAGWSALRVGGWMTMDRRAPPETPEFDDACGMVWGV